LRFGQVGLVKEVPFRRAALHFITGLRLWILRSIAGISNLPCGSVRLAMGLMSRSVEPPPTMFEAARFLSARPRQSAENCIYQGIASVLFINSSGKDHHLRR
jgi:hypothetical protein